MTAYIIIDVDGYCHGGISQRRVVSATADGFRARELAWAGFHGARFARGSVYFHDAGVAPLSLADTTIHFARRLHYLPTHPAPDAYGDEVALPATELLRAIRAVHDAVREAMGAERVVFVHKGGSEGAWAAEAVPGVATLDLGDHGCPRVDALAKDYEHPPSCPHHERATKKRVVHCPALEIILMVAWAQG